MVVGCCEVVVQCSVVLFGAVCCVCVMVCGVGEFGVGNPDLGGGKRRQEAAHH